MARCEVNPINDCWIWTGATQGDNVPCMWLPEIGKHGGLAMAAAVLMTGRQPKKGVIWHATCSTRCCANPWHRKPGNRSTQMKAATPARSPLTRARIAAGKRAKSKITWEDAAAIRLSTGPLRIQAEQYGISIDMVWRIRKGLSWASTSAPGNSVFNLIGALA